MFSKKAIEIDEIFTLDLTLYSKCQIDGEDLANFCGLIREHKVQHNDNPHVGTQVNSLLWQMIVTVDLSLFLEPLQNTAFTEKVLYIYTSFCFLEYILKVG